jgi:hypothetical protein
VSEETGNVCSGGLIGRNTAARARGLWPFVLGVGAVYVLGFAGQWLTARIILTQVGLWPFLLMQIVLIGAWAMLHAGRLRDAGRTIAPAQGLAVIHVLAIVLLILVGAFYMEGAAGDGRMPESLLLVRQLITFSRGADLLTALGLVACVALLVPPLFSVWAAMLPGRHA